MTFQIYDNCMDPAVGPTRWTKLDTHALVDFIRSTEQSGDNRHSLPETVQFATRKNKPGHVTPRSNDIPPRKPFSSFLCLFFVSRIFLVSSLFSPHLNTPFKDPRGKKLYFVYTRHERYYKRENVFLQNFTEFLSFALLNTRKKLKLKI